MSMTPAPGTIPSLQRKAHLRLLEAAFVLAFVVGLGWPRPSWAVTYFCCQYDSPKCDGVQSPPADMTRAAKACRANGGNPMPAYECVNRTCTRPTPFTPTGTFDNPGTQSGKSTDIDTSTSPPRTRERDDQNSVELVYNVSKTTSSCTKIATIQVTWNTDASGKLRSNKDWVDAPPAGPNPAAEKMDAAAADGGYSVDFRGPETTPYYQDSGNGNLNQGITGNSNGKGRGTATHTTDTTGHSTGWTEHFEDWTVCIEGSNIGEVLAGVVWEVTDTGVRITDRAPKNPSDHFKNAVKSWEKWYNDLNPATPFSEPGGGFQW
jgi:hypothetical protein